MNKLIAFTGPKGVGKDTAATLFYQHGYKKVSFADPLRYAAQVIFGLTAEEMNDRKLKEEPLRRYPYQSPRQILQTLGTDCVRAHYPEAWVEAAKRRIGNLFVAGHGVIITDLRFENEAQLVRKIGGLIVSIQREGYGTGDDHVSEAGIPSQYIDIYLRNTAQSEEEWARTAFEYISSEEGIYDAVV